MTRIFLLGFVLLHGFVNAQSDRVSPRLGDTRGVGGITFAFIPGGEQSLWMASTEVTFRQWKAFLADSGTSAGRSQGLSDDHPVVSITWDEAKAFCDWFSRKHSVVVRLPTEAEWEYSARGGLKGQQYPNGNSLLPGDANVDQRGPVRVGSYRPNGYGLYDMAGNVFEWVADWYDPARPQRRADRGGGWCMNAERARVSARHAGPGVWDQGGTADCLGFRPVMELKGS